MHVEKSHIGITNVENNMARIWLSPIALSMAGVTQRLRTTGQSCTLYLGRRTGLIRRLSAAGDRSGRLTR